MIHGHEAPAVPRINKALAAPASALVVQVRLAPFSVGEPATTVLDNDLEDLCSSEGADKPRMKLFNGLIVPWEVYRSTGMIPPTQTIAAVISQYLGFRA